MSDSNAVNDLLARHKQALNDYRHWDEQVKNLLKGRRAKDLDQNDMDVYREAAHKRDTAYDQMRHLERALLDDVTGAATTNFGRGPKKQD